MIFLTRPFVGEDEVQAVRKVIESKYLTEGPVTIEFEKKFAEYVGVKYGVATTSCTSGMEVCLRAVGVGPGDEVIVPDFTFPASALAVMGLGAKPVLVDVGPAILHDRSSKGRRTCHKENSSDPLRLELRISHRI